MTFSDTRKRLGFLLALLCSAGSLVGCSTSSRGTSPGLILFVPGVAGDGAAYKNIVPALRDAGDTRTVESFSWGAPSIAFFMNFNNVGIHESAEKKLADRIVHFCKEHPTEKVDLIAHSAGGGVTLGALAKLPAGTRIGTVILLHPSVSPTYPLAKSLAACDAVTLFYSAHDTTFLSWRTSNFGTYDNVKTKAAGNAGFDMSSLTAEERTKVKQIAFADADKALGNDGEHFGPLARAYLKARVMPLIARITSAVSPAR